VIQFAKKMGYRKLGVASCIGLREEADILNTVVSAASIIAKVIRDKEIEMIKREFEKIGSGYPSDKKTMEFIRTCIIDQNNCPSFIRKSWKPVKNLFMVKQQKIYDFI